LVERSGVVAVDRGGGAREVVEVGSALDDR
jgi:hypothetical protein